jgi:hypothetical protein
VSVVAGYAAPRSGVFLNGNEVLVDASSAVYFRLMQPSSGGVDAFDVEVPCATALVGLTMSVQGGLLGGGLELCNALDVTFGHY